MEADVAQEVGHHHSHERFVLDQQHAPALGRDSRAVETGVAAARGFRDGFFDAVEASPIEIDMPKARPSGRQSNIAVPLSCCWMLAVMTLVP